MFYVYVLKGLSIPKYYIGYTADLKRRFMEHNAGSNSSTKRGRPWQLLYYEAFLEEEMACDREMTLKEYGRIWQQLKKRIDKPQN